MLNLETGEMNVAGIPDQLQRWEVWFATMEGTFPKLEEALESCNKTGQPAFTIKALPVAMGSKTYEIVNW